MNCSFSNKEYFFNWAKLEQSTSLPLIQMIYDCTLKKGNILTQ